MKHKVSSGLILYYLIWQWTRPIYQGTSLISKFLPVFIQYDLPAGQGIWERILASCWTVVCDIPRDACAVAYNKSFECGRIEEMANYLSTCVSICWTSVSISSTCLSRSSHVTTMFRQWRTLSLRAPALPNEELNSTNENVQNGAMAMNAYPAMRHMNESQVAEMRKALLGILLSGLEWCVSEKLMKFLISTFN